MLMSSGHDFDRMSRRRAFSSESCGLTEIFAHRIGVSNATSAQYRLGSKFNEVKSLKITIKIRTIQALGLAP